MTQKDSNHLYSFSWVQTSDGSILDLDTLIELQVAVSGNAEAIAVIDRIKEL